MCKLTLKEKKSKLKNFGSTWKKSKFNKHRPFNKAVAPGKNPKFNNHRATFITDSRVACVLMNSSHHLGINYYVNFYLFIFFFGGGGGIGSNEFQLK